ncbi:universal stress protein [Winogradskyella sp. DF17]|uniref:Universal stress protein n=1 Tax=Winogradskyella pelagia TaxID=2819984 RepID=A0ABS3SZR6_9FLAO|nr:universal stress protein [Winogradskyella sp. DF17]MBO3115977.1 universal stress protein [Winogradskyella sp. DF17]
MKHILLLTDYSTIALNGMHYALQLFAKVPCTFYVCHIKKAKSYISDDLITSSSASVYKSLIKDEKLKLKAITSGLKNQYHNPLHKFKVIVDYDAFIDSIKQNIEHYNIEMVVMGSNGASNAAESIFGSNTLKVIRNIDIPTLVIPELYRYSPLHDILLPLDSYDPNDGDLFTRFLEFSKPYKSKLHILRITDTADAKNDNDDELQHLSQIITDNEFEYHYIKNVPIHFSVSNYIQTHHIDLMVLFEQTESFFNRFFFGSATTRLSQDLVTPLLVYHY